MERRIMVNVASFIVASLCVFGFVALLNTDPSFRKDTYSISTFDRTYYTLSVDTIPNGVQFIDLKSNKFVKVYGNYSISEPLKK